MLTELAGRWSLVMAFAKRDLAVRYRSTALGWLWSLVQPMMNLLFFSFVFIVIFKIQAPPMGNGRGEFYPAFLLCGLVTWNFFASQQRLSIDSLRSCNRLLEKVSFPGWAAVVGAQLVQALQVMMELAVLVVLLLVLGNIGWTWLLAVPILAATILFGMGVGLMVAILDAHVGDVKEIVAVVLRALYFATPILYPLSMVQGQSQLLAKVVMLNPMSWFVQGMHDVMYSLVAPPLWAIAAMVLGGALTFLAGFAVFRRGSRDLAELL